MLRYSRPCAEIFEKEQERQRQLGRKGSGPGGKVSHLGFAKERFDSTAKPLAVAIWNLDAVISTSTIIERDVGFHAEYRTSCRKYLDGLCAHKSILMCMLADAIGEVLTRCRFFVREAFQTESMAANSSAVKVAFMRKAA